MRRERERGVSQVGLFMEMYSREGAENEGFFLDPLGVEGISALEDVGEEESRASP